MELLDFSFFIILFGFFQSLLLVGFFYFLDSYRAPTKLFTFSFIFLSIIFLFGIFFHLNLHLKYPHLSRVGLPIGALVAPTFALGAQKYFGYLKDNKYWNIAYFTAPVLIFIYLIPYFLLSQDDKLSYILKDKNLLSMDCIVINIISIFSNLIIFIRIYYRLKMLSKEYTQKILNQINLFNKLVFFCIIILIVSLLIFFLNPGRNTESLANALFALWVIIFAWNQIYIQLIQQNKSYIMTNKNKYSKSLLSNEQLSVYGKQIEEFMNIQENLKNPELNLEMIAAHINLSPNLTSQVINRYFSKNLLEIIRNFRIAIAENLLKNTDFSILRIGLEIGYNSKSSFLRAFKEEKGTTPSHFKNQIL
ncbi:MAG: helix-turn-helix transcriptional regulator [Leptospira sp.]|nr:helix-turn-helix transcriptional regulator [Leptospira sp.]